MKSKNFVSLFLAVVLVLITCQHVNAKTNVSQTIELTAITGSTICIEKNESIQLTGSIKSCKSKNKKIATVTKNGILTGKKKGSTSVTLKTANKTFTLKVTVGTRTKEIKGLNDTYSLENGETLQLSPTATPVASSVPGFHYTSLNKSIFTVSAKGKIMAKGEGNAALKITSKDNRCSQTVSITVTKAVTTYEFNSYEDLYDVLTLKQKEGTGIRLKENSELVINGQTVIGYQDETAMMTYDLYECRVEPKLAIWMNGTGQIIVSIINGKATILSPSIFQHFSLFSATTWGSDPAELHIRSSMFDSLMQGNYRNNEISCIFSAETSANLYIDEDLVVSNDGSAFYNSKYGDISLCFWTDDDKTRKCNFVTKKRCFIKEYSVNGMEINFREKN